MLTSEVIGERLKQAREQAGLSQQKAAEVLDVPRSAISKIESGQQKIDSIQIRTLSEQYGVSLDELLADPDEQSELPPVESKEEIRLRIERNSDQFQEYGVEKFVLFGSVVRDELTPDSDIDMVVFADDIAGYWTLTELRQKVEDILGRDVDLATPEMVEDIWEEEIQDQGIELRAA